MHLLKFVYLTYRFYWGIIIRLTLQSQLFSLKPILAGYGVLKVNYKHIFVKYYTY